MELLRATKENDLFRDLEAQWQGQLAKYDENIDDYITSFRDHCKSVIEGNYANYFVYILHNNGAHEAFLHVNHAKIKRLPGYTLRVLEVYLAPIHDYEDITKENMAKICSGVFTGLIKLAKEELSASNIKIHMGPLDKDYLIAFASILSSDLGIEITAQGSWLVIKNVTS